MFREGLGLDDGIARDLLTFSLTDLDALGRRLSDDYKSAEPWPHAVIDDFLPDRVARNTLSVFPDPEHAAWLDWTKRDTDHQPKKQGIGSAARLEGVSPYMQHVLGAFLSFPFVNFLEQLTGIPKLIPDPHFFGGGLQQVLSGGHLSVHADFNYLEALDLYRRINALIYLNEDWKPEYNGDLELWEPAERKCVKSVAPLFNRLVVFNTTKRSLHGHPKPLNTPPGVTRKALAFYYYTAKPAEGDHYDARTDWVNTEGT